MSSKHGRMKDSQELGFNFYDKMDSQDKRRYCLMLETIYILLKCDEAAFVETNELGQNFVSGSFLHSIQNAKVSWGLDETAYPQGSISANRHNYEALRNYYGGTFPDTEECNYFRQRLKHFLTLRRDDSHPTGSLLFGSSFKIEQANSGRDAKHFRRVEVSLRHAAAALWILVEESRGVIPVKLRKSILAFYSRTEKYLRKDMEWEHDSFKHMTIASALKACGAVKIYLEHEDTSDDRLFSKNEKIMNKLSLALFDPKSIAQSMDGSYYLVYPDIHSTSMVTFEYFLCFFTLTLIPEYFNDDPKLQSVLRGIIGHTIETAVGAGLPINKHVHDPIMGNAIQDFGSTASALYVFWHCLENRAEGDAWQAYCKEYFDRYLQFCLSAFNNADYYVFPYVESISKILLLPRPMIDRGGKLDAEARSLIVESYVDQLRKAIKIVQGKGDRKHFNKTIHGITCPEGLEHVADIILLWDIPKYWGKQSLWGLVPSPGDLGEFTGGLLKSFLSP
jgi:hypothetical protein